MLVMTSLVTAVDVDWSVAPVLASVVLFELVSVPSDSNFCTVKIRIQTATFVLAKTSWPSLCWPSLVASGILLSPRNGTNSMDFETLQLFWQIFAVLAVHSASFG